MCVSDSKLGGQNLNSLKTSMGSSGELENNITNYGYYELREIKAYCLEFLRFLKVKVPKWAEYGGKNNYEFHFISIMDASNQKHLQSYINVFDEFKNANESSCKIDSCNQSIKVLDCIRQSNELKQTSKQLSNDNKSEAWQLNESCKADFSSEMGSSENIILSASNFQNPPWVENENDNNSNWHQINPVVLIDYLAPYIITCDQNKGGNVSNCQSFSHCTWSLERVGDEKIPELLNYLASEIPNDYYDRSKFSQNSKLKFYIYSQKIDS